MSDRVLVTGGLGFIGSEFVRRLAAAGHDILNVDLDTYAGDRRRLAETTGAVETVEMDIADSRIAGLIEKRRPSVLVHFAAATHVTRSETDEGTFFNTNVEGTRSLIEAARASGIDLFLHVSTDEVYGPCHGEPFQEGDKLPGEGLATSAYARSKALGDDMVLSYRDEVPVIVVRPTNCFGPWQHPEKAVARWTTRALDSSPIPVWGGGGQIRDWMFVTDVCAAIETVISSGTPGEVYNLGPGLSGTSNVEIARMVVDAAGSDPDLVYLTAYDRPQHDEIYAVDVTKIRSLGWEPLTDLATSLETTVTWYADNRSWWEPLLEEAERLYDDADPARSTGAGT